MAGNIAKLLRIIIDFTSSNAASLGTQENKEDLPRSKSIFSAIDSHEPSYVDKAIMFLNQGEIDMRETLTKILGADSTNPWKSLTFKVSDIFNIPLGIVEGSMAAI